MNNITETMLKEISNWNGSFKGAYNIRENGCSVGRQSSENIKIDSKTDQPGLDIHILPGTKGETVSIPACVTHGDVDDLVYNDFYVGEGADVIIVAGCGVHTETGEPARHNGIHRFFLAPNSHVKYVEKHIGTGKGFGIRTIDPVTEVFLEENAVLEMDTAQIGGVDRTTRKTKATVAAGGKLLIRERILTEKEQTADTEFEVELNGEDSSADIVSPVLCVHHCGQRSLQRPFRVRRDYRRHSGGRRCSKALGSQCRCGSDSRGCYWKDCRRADIEAAYPRTDGGGSGEEDYRRFPELRYQPERIQGVTILSLCTSTIKKRET